MVTSRWNDVTAGALNVSYRDGHEVEASWRAGGWGTINSIIAPNTGRKKGRFHGMAYIIS